MASAVPLGTGGDPRACTDDIAVNNYIRLVRLAACRDEKLLNVKKVKVFDENALESIVSLAFQPDTDAP